MAFWLARERRGQEHSHIQRFDPRFWTVDFPRPAMASVTTLGPDAIQVDCEFLHEGELVGLIWESEDRFDHPLLAYQTHRDYARSTLSFRWQSNGVVPLDQVNGPTLTIEGRDTAGNARTWYVRLWNYATGTPTDAFVELPFSNLGSGWELPGEPAYAGDIDRMFISLTPEGYVPGSDAPLAQRAVGSLTISGIACDGANAMLELGDVLLPVHGERLATAYDDAYNQTPARLVRNMFALGYREEVVHYVGMSHFPQLQGGGSLEVSQPAQLCGPAAQWHQSYFQQCAEFGFDSIVSLSFELFDQYCPEAWKQRTQDGAPALTGWVPPSTLLTPANAAAITWLKQIATQFAMLQQAAGQPVKFQIGEPWWWVKTDGRPCIYDDAAIASFGGVPPSIADMRLPLDESQKALLDAAGEKLAQATSAIATAVRSASESPAELHLLVFTPTVLDPQMPELHRANLPAGWAFPAFDRLQLEDYDWLTTGQEARRRHAYRAVDQALGYPTEKQDYLAGFVLSADDADTLWPRIDRGLDEARARGIERRYVWALPQIARDGYTRLAPPKEEPMQAIDPVPYPFPLGRSAAVSPEFSTSIVVTTSGHERRNSLWSDARLHFDVGPGIRSESELSELIGFFRARRGAARGFLLRDPLDFSSRGMTGTPTAFDQLIGIGDGARSTFELVKRYGDEDPQLRPITRPVPETVRISVGGAELSEWEIAPGGKITLDSPPPSGAEVRAGFLFDVPVRFAEDRIDVSGFNFAAGEAPSIPLVEVREVN